MKLARAVFLDRDGTLVRTFPEGPTTRGPRTLAEVGILPGVEEACRLLRAAGWLLVCVSNQPDIARGLTSHDEQLAIDLRLIGDLGLTACYVCDHDAGDNCGCRKPRPGLIHIAAYEHAICLADSIMIGDRESDRLAGIRAGCKHQILVTLDHPLLEHAEWIVQHLC